MKQLSDEYKGWQLSHGTMRPEDLLQKYIDFTETELKTDSGTYKQCANVKLKNEARKMLRLLELTEELGYIDEYLDWKVESGYILEKIYEHLNIIAPEGCYYGSTPGDGTRYGFWEIEKESVI